jgi:hypothetical protein
MLLVGNKVQWEHEKTYIQSSPLLTNSFIFVPVPTAPKPRSGFTTPFVMFLCSMVWSKTSLFVKNYRGTSWMLIIILYFCINYYSVIYRLIMYKKLYKNKIQLKNKSEQAKTTVKMSCPVMSCNVKSTL